MSSVIQNKSTTMKLLELCYSTGPVQAVLTYQLFTNCTDGVLSNLSGRRSISLSMFANLTGSSCLRKAKEVLSHPFVEPTKQIQQNKMLCVGGKREITIQISVFLQT